MRLQNYKYFGRQDSISLINIRCEGKWRTDERKRAFAFKPAKFFRKGIQET